MTEIELTKAKYLGNSVYVSCENGRLTLYTENIHCGRTNTISLNPDMFAELRRYAQHYRDVTYTVIDKMGKAK